MPLPRVLRTTTFRLAAIYVGGFAAAVAILGVATYLATAGLLERRLDNRIEREMQQLNADRSQMQRSKLNIIQWQSLLSLGNA